MFITVLEIPEEEKYRRRSFRRFRQLGRERDLEFVFGKVLRLRQTPPFWRKYPLFSYKVYFLLLPKSIPCQKKTRRCWNVESIVLSARSVARLQGEIVLHCPVLGEQPGGLDTAASGCNDDDDDVHPSSLDKPRALFSPPAHLAWWESIALLEDRWHFWINSLSRTFLDHRPIFKTNLMEVFLQCRMLIFHFLCFKSWKFLPFLFVW